MLLGMFTTVQAQFTFTTNNGATTITGYTGSNSLVTIPITLAGLPVVAISDWAFYSSSVTSVLISDGVTNIGDGAFFDCESLTNIMVGSGVTNIGDWAFAFCPNLSSIYCRGNAPNVAGTNMFYDSSATLYYLPGATGWGPTFDGVTAILWSPTVPFAYTINSDGVSLTITEYTGSDSVVTIPDNINFLPVTGIGANPFYYSLGVNDVFIGSGINTINDFAFVNCQSLLAITVDTNNVDFRSLDGVLFNYNQTDLLVYPRARSGAYAIPDSVTTVGDFSFEFSEELTGITIPESVTNIGEGAFSSCASLTSVTIPQGITSITDSLFADCQKLSAIVIPSNVKVIADGAFYGCDSLTNVTIPEGVTKIGDSTFYSCNRLPAITLPDSVTCIGANVFEFCGSLASITLPKGITSLSASMFTWCTNLTEFTMPTNLTSIGDATFSTCSKLTNVMIPSSVVSIGSGAFAGCSSLVNITIPSGITNIESGVFFNCSGLTNIIIPNGITTIGADAFNSCSGLTSIVIPDSVTEIGAGAFGGCSSLANITLPNGITSIAEDEFYSCASLTNVTIPNGVKSIGDYAFNYCPSLTSLTIPASVTNIEDDAFSFCSNLKSCFFYGNAPSSIGSYIFNFSLDAIAYYLPDTTGWEDFSDLAYCTTEPWLPQMQTTGVASVTNPFSFNINWANGQTVVVEACTNLANPVWQPVQTNTLEIGTASFSDPQWTNYPNRFYRLRSP